MDLAELQQNVKLYPLTYPPSCYIERVHTSTSIMNNHPIEMALAITLASIQSLLWLINELAGFHKHQATYAETGDIIDMTWDEFIQPSKDIRKHQEFCQLLALAVA
jgi:hypothetical protein